jgi:hypothetical protein
MNKKGTSMAKGGKIKIFSHPVGGFVSSKSISQGDWRAYERAKQVIEEQIRWDEFDKVTVDGKEVTPKEFEAMKDKFYNESFAKGGETKSFWDKTKDFGKKASAKAKDYGKKGVDATKQAIHDKKKRSAMNVLYETRKHRTGTVKEKNTLERAEEIVFDKYAKGGSVKTKYFTGHLSFLNW